MLVLSPRKPLCRVFAGAPILLKLSVVSPRRTAPYVGDVIDTRIAAFRYRSIYLPVALSEAGGRARPPPVAEKGRARSGSNRERRAGGLPHALRDHVATGARKEEQRPYDDHPESRSQFPKCGEAPSLFPKSIAHPAEGSQLTGHRLARPPYMSKPAQREGFGHESAFSFDRERPFSFRRNRKENGGFIPRAAKQRTPPSRPVGRLPPSPPAGGHRTFSLLQSPRDYAILPP